MSKYKYYPFEWQATPGNYSRVHVELCPLQFKSCQTPPFHRCPHFAGRTFDRNRIPADMVMCRYMEVPAKVYTHRNFRFKKDLVAAVAAFKKGEGPAVTYYQPGPFGGNEPQDGTIYLEGPHYPEPHRWYAQAEVKDGVIVKVAR